MSQIIITGEPVALFTFADIPSANVAIDQARAHWSVGRSFTKSWRVTGECVALEVRRRLGFPESFSSTILRRFSSAARRAFTWSNSEVVTVYSGLAGSI